MGVKGGIGLRTPTSALDPMQPATLSISRPVSSRKVQQFEFQPQNERAAPEKQHFQNNNWVHRNTFIMAI